MTDQSLDLKHESTQTKRSIIFSLGEAETAIMSKS